MIHIKRKSLFLIDREKEKTDGSLRYRIRWDGNLVAFKLGFRVELDKWSTDTQRVKNNTTHGKKKIAASVINRRINKFEDIAESIFAEYENNDRVPSAEEFRMEFNKQNGKIVEVDYNPGFFEVFDTFTLEMGTTNQWTKSTFQKFDTARKHLMEFDPDIEFDILTDHTLQRYIIYLRDKQNMRNSTVIKQLGFLKWFLRWADSKGYVKVKAYLTFSPKLKTSEKKVIFLEWSELMDMYHFDIPDTKHYLERIRDVFCFCCFTSLRYSDVANLKRSNVFNDHISITTVKTADNLKIELNDYSKEILNKYKNEVYFDDLALPVISNQKMNDYLKELGELCGIDTPINITYYKGNKRIDKVYPKYALLSSHCGRRTFICNALMLGIAPQIVMKWTGHSDYKAMKPYIDIADSAKANAMKIFNKSRH